MPGIPVKFQPFAKAIGPAFLTLVGVGVDWLSQGTFDKQTAAIAITGLVAAAVAFFIPNAKPAPPVAPSK